MKVSVLLALLLTLVACPGENAGVQRMLEEAQEAERVEVARIKELRKGLDPVLAHTLSADVVLRGYINVGDACAFIIDPDLPRGCAAAELPGKCWGALFVLEKPGWRLVGSGNRDELVFPPRCQVGIILAGGFRHVGDLSRVSTD